MRNVAATLPPEAERCTALPLQREGCESDAELQVLCRQADRAKVVTEAALLINFAAAVVPRSDPSAARLQAGVWPLLTCSPVAAAAAAATAHRATAGWLEGCPPAAHTPVAELSNQLNGAAVRLLTLTFTIRARLAQSVMHLDAPAARAARRQQPLSASQLLTPDAVSTFCSAVQQAVDGLRGTQQLLSKKAGTAAQAGTAAHAAQQVTAQHMTALVAEYASCLFSIVQLVPPGGPAWQRIDQALCGQPLEAALPNLLEAASEGLMAFFSFGSECAVAHTAEAHAGCVLVAAAVVEGRLRQLLSLLRPEQQSGSGALQQDAAERVWDDLQHAAEVASALGEPASVSLSGHRPQPRLPETRQCQLRVLYAGAALQSLAADASSGSGRSSRAAASWAALAASAESEEAAGAAGAWAELLLEFKEALNRGDDHPSFERSQARRLLASLLNRF